THYCWRTSLIGYISPTLIDSSHFFFFQAEDGIRDFHVTGVQTCALPISLVVDRDWQTRFLNSLEKRRSIFFYDLGMQAADFLDLFPHRFQASNQVFGQMFAFAFAHFD